MNSGSSASIHSGSHVGRGVLHQVVPPEVAAGLHVDRQLIPADALVRRCRCVTVTPCFSADVHGLVGVGLERDGLGAAVDAVGGDQDLAGGVDDAVGQRVGAEAAEDDRVDRADAGAGQHGDGQFLDHRHVDRDAVALLDAAALEHVGELADLLVELAVGELCVLAGLVAFPDDRDLVAARLQVPVQAVVGDVGLAADEPLDRDVALSKSYSRTLRPLLLPVELVGDLAPRTRRGP